MTSSPIRAAVIGTGGISRGMHIPALAALAPRVEIVAVVDIDAALARTTAETVGHPGRLHRRRPRCSPPRSRTS
jgi:predicted dehydrogenase